MALRDGAVDPARLAAVAAGWPTYPPTPFAQFLVAQGLLSPDQQKRLEQAADDATPVSADDSRNPADVLTATGNQPRTTETVDLPAGTARQAATDDPPAVGGRYQVEGLHRAGGLGRVWRAKDATLGREVALKDLRPDRAEDPRVRARFVEEARITGQLEHPCIVPLYDLIDGPAGPCYTMRFVAGRTLAEAARDYHAKRTAGTATPLDLAALLDAFVAVCRAVAFAHSRSVLHRDLKGQNIVLGEYGEVFVLDWGLAKLAGPAVAAGPAVVTPAPDGSRQETITGAVMGTPAFMAPELTDGAPASRASDVYALGGVLYVILTGKPPYENSTIDNVFDKIRDGALPLPRLLNPTCPPALEAVCLKAMARVAADRYPSASALAEEVRRWRADEPVVAHREVWPARAARWGRRHRPVVAGGLAMLVTAVIGLAVSTGLVWRGERRTAEQKEHVEREWARAEENLSRSNQLALAFLDISDTQVAMVPQKEDLRKATADACVDAFRQALTQRPDDPKLRQQTARAYHYAGNLHRLKNETMAADSLYRQSIRLLDDLTADYPDDETTREQLAGALQDQARLFGRLGRFRDATTAALRSADLVERLVISHSDRSDYRRTLVTNLTDMSGYQYTRAEFSASEQSARRSERAALDHLTVLGQAATPDDRILLVIALHRLAMVLHDLDRPDESRAKSSEALDKLRHFSEKDAVAQHYRARVLVDRAKVPFKTPEDRAAAERDVGDAIAIWDGLQKTFPRFAMYREWQASAYEIRGRVRAAQADKTAAANDLDKARMMLEEFVAEAPNVPAYRGLLGRTYLTIGLLEVAREAPARAATAFAKARDNFKSAVDRSPENAIDQNGLNEAQKALTQVNSPRR
jgi:serine/threonine-protein kinase